MTGKMSQLSGQLKDILSESTEDVVDPSTQLKVNSDKLKESERHIELYKMECVRWQEQCNELQVKCETFEVQLEQRSNDYRAQINAKDVRVCLFLFSTNN